MPFEMGAHPGLNGQYAILEFPDASDSSVVYIEGVTSDLYLEKAHDVQSYSVMYEHLAGAGAECGPDAAVHRRHRERVRALTVPTPGSPPTPSAEEVPHDTPPPLRTEDPNGICHPVE